MISRRGLFCSASAGIAWVGLNSRALAQSGSYPAHTVRWIVPYTAGGATDVLSRLICQQLSERLGQTFIVENKPGAGSNIGTQAVISAPPDGYTLLLTSTKRHQRLVRSVIALRLCQKHHARCGPGAHSPG